MFSNKNFFILPPKFNEEEKDQVSKSIEKNKGRILKDEELEEILGSDQEVIVLTMLSSAKRILRSFDFLTNSALTKLEVVKVEWLHKCLEQEKIVNMDRYVIPLHATGSNESVTSEQEPITPQKRPRESASSELAYSDLDETESYISPTAVSSNETISGYKPQKYECQQRTPLHCPNDNIVEQLQMISKARSLMTEYRSAMTYQKAISSIRAFSIKLTPTNFNLIDHIPNVGPKIRDLCESIVKSGSCAEADALKNDGKIKCLEVFCSIYGVGSKTALKWYEDLNWRGLDDIFFDDLTKTQKIWLKYFDDLSIKLKRSEVELITKHVESWIKEVDSQCVMTVVGGYRRGKEESGDIDIIVSHPEEDRKYGPKGVLLDQICDKLKKEGFINEILHYSVNKSAIPETYIQSAARKSKAGGFGSDHLDQITAICYEKDLHRHFQLDLLVAAKSAYAAAILGWTGSTQFERSLRLYSKRERNIHITSYAIYDVSSGQKITTRNEKEIFKILGLEYLEPYYRNC